MHQVVLFFLFNLFIFSMLVLDLRIFHRKAHSVKVKEALWLTLFWVSLGMLFCLGVYLKRGPDVGLKFLTGYLLEYSLSVDNIFVFLLIFSYFHVPAHYQHKVLFWGIVGACVMRALFILLGVALIHQFHWIVYLFGVFLVLTGFKLAFEKDKEIKPEKNPVLKLFRRIMPVTDQYEGDKFLVKRERRYWATPMLVVLLVVESTDVIFAVDSIPAILAITTDPFIVYTSNMFAILGLRSLYFALAAIMKLFHHLHYGLAVILAFVGVKMLLSDIHKIPVGAALGVIVSILLISIIASLVFPKKADEKP